MAVFRVEKNRNYTVMSNVHLKDSGISLKAKGLLSVILSLPEDWNYTTRGLAAICKEGVDSIGAALRELESAGISYVLHTYEDDGDESVGLGVAISEQLGEEPGQGFKTLVCVTPSNDYVVCCIPVADELDLKSAARAAGEKSLAMMHVKDLLAATGYVRGGCSPVGMKKRYRTLIDETCVLWDTIFISGGKRGYQLELAPDDLIAFCGATVAAITRED